MRLRNLFLSALILIFGSIGNTTPLKLTAGDQLHFVNTAAVTPKTWYNPLAKGQRTCNIEAGANLTVKRIQKGMNVAGAWFGPLAEVEYSSPSGKVRNLYSCPNHSVFLFSMDYGPKFTVDKKIAATPTTPELTDTEVKSALPKITQ